jgi:hypothetical protein
MNTYIVVCSDSGIWYDEDGNSHDEPTYYLATRRVFTSFDAAQTYARTINTSRNPLVVVGRWNELNFENDSHT